MVSMGKKNKATMFVQCDKHRDEVYVKSTEQGSTYQFLKRVLISSEKKETRARVQIHSHQLPFELLKQLSDLFLCLGLFPLRSSQHRALTVIPRLITKSILCNMTYKDLHNLALPHLSGLLSPTSCTLRLVASTVMCLLPVCFPPTSPQKQSLYLLHIVSPVPGVISGRQLTPSKCLIN